eukprot:EG_transcript_3498
MAYPPAGRLNGPLFSDDQDTSHRRPSSADSVGLSPIEKRLEQARATVERAEQRALEAMIDRDAALTSLKAGRASRSFFQGEELSPESELERLRTALQQKTSRLAEVEAALRQLETERRGWLQKRDQLEKALEEHRQAQQGTVSVAEFQAMQAQLSQAWGERDLARAALETETAARHTLQAEYAALQHAVEELQRGAQRPGQSVETAEIKVIPPPEQAGGLQQLQEALQREAARCAELRERLAAAQASSTLAEESLAKEREAWKRSQEAMQQQLQQALRQGGQWAGADEQLRAMKAELALREEEFEKKRDAWLWAKANSQATLAADRQTLTTEQEALGQEVAMLTVALTELQRERETLQEHYVQLQGEKAVMQQQLQQALLQGAGQWANADEQLKALKAELELRLEEFEKRRDTWLWAKADSEATLAADRQTLMTEQEALAKEVEVLAQALEEYENEKDMLREQKMKLNHEKARLRQLEVAMTAERERYKAWDAKLVARQAALEEARSKHRRLREELDRQIEEWKKAKADAQAAAQAGLSRAVAVPAADPGRGAGPDGGGDLAQQRAQLEEERAQLQRARAEWDQQREEWRRAKATRDRAEAELMAKRESLLHFSAMKAASDVQRLEEWSSRLHATQQELWDMELRMMNARIPGSLAVSPQFMPGNLLMLEPPSASTSYAVSPHKRLPRRVADWELFHAVAVDLNVLVSFRLAFIKLDPMRSGVLLLSQLLALGELLAVPEATLGRIAGLAVQVDSSQSGRLDFWQLFGIQVYVECNLAAFDFASWMQFVTQSPYHWPPRPRPRAA